MTKETEKDYEALKKLSFIRESIRVKKKKNKKKSIGKK